MQRLLVAVLLAVLATSVSGQGCSSGTETGGPYKVNLSGGQWGAGYMCQGPEEGVCLMGPFKSQTVCLKNALGPLAKHIAKLPAAEKAKFDEAYKNAKGFPKVCACRDLVRRRPAPPCAALPEAALARVP